MLIPTLLDRKNTCISLDYFLEKNFPTPSRIIYTKVLSSGKFSQDHTTITKEDTTFRQELIQGVVHDSMMTICGGIADNSGLSSNANDLVNLLQMGLQDIYYKGKRYLSTSIVPTFTNK